MILPKAEDAIHKAQMYRILSDLLDDPIICQNVFFKGGTCASMLGFLDRFSIDLDFDVKRNINKKIIDVKLRKIFKGLGLVVAKKSKGSLFYVMKYETPKHTRNSIKLSFIDYPIKSNIYASLYLTEINRFAICQTKETMFGNKLVAVTDRYKKYHALAGRDIYDVHHFFLQGYHYQEKIIVERTGKKVTDYLQELIDFIQRKVSEKVISEDLSFLLPYDKFKLMRKVLKTETMLFLQNEVRRLDNSFTQK